VIPVVGGSSPLGHPILPHAPLHWRAPALRGGTPQAAFRAVVHVALAQIQTNARGVLLSDEPEFLHQLRVGLRRLRSALRAFRKTLDKKEARRVARALRKVTPKLGAARDWDVLIARLVAVGEVELLQKARKRREAARRTARRALTSRAFSRLPAQVRALRTTARSRSLNEFGAAALGRAHAKVTKKARGVDWSDAAQRHEVRIQLKRLRYSCEFFGPAFPRTRAAPYIAALKELQDIFGELNDIAVGQRLLDVAGEETALLRRLAPAWRAFQRRRPFWRAAA
jgi:triphosphatase